MSQGKETRQREISAGYELQLADCVYFCLHYAYPLHHISAFKKEFIRDWSVNDSAVWASTPLPGKRFVVYGTGTDEDFHWQVPSRPGPSLLKTSLLAAHAPSDVFGRCASLFERMLGVCHFRTPKTSRELRSTMTVLQEEGTGTCWLAAALNLVLHVPETRLVLWKELNRKIPRMSDATLDLFVTTPTGRRVYHNYRRLYRASRGAETTPLERNTGGGLANTLVDAMKVTMQDMKVLQTAPRDDELDRLIRNAVGSDEDSAMKVLGYVERTLLPRGIAGGLLTGYSRKAGHAVALCIDADDPAKVRIHNHGVSGRGMTLLHFLNAYPRNITVQLYRVSKVRRCGVDFSPAHC